MRRFKKALIERALGGELTHHLGYPPGAKPDGARNQRNGTTSKTVLTDDGAVAIDVPRDRAGSFEPVLIPKHERRFTGFDDKILALYARGLTVREIQAFLAEMYAVEVSPDLISTVTEQLNEIAANDRATLACLPQFTLRVSSCHSQVVDSLRDREALGLEGAFCAQDRSNSLILKRRNVEWFKEHAWKLL